MANCKAVATRQVPTRGKSSIEWHDKDGKPRRYCYGYQDCSTEELLPVCRECRNNVIYAQEDWEEFATCEALPKQVTHWMPLPEPYKEVEK